MVAFALLIPVLSHMTWTVSHLIWPDWSPVSSELVHVRAWGATGVALSDLIWSEARAPAFSRNVRLCVAALEDDAQGGRDGRVAGVVAQRGGEVDGPGPAEHPDHQVAQGRR